MNVKYARAYTEVLEILKYLPDEIVNEIPHEKLEFFESKKDDSYEFQINPEIPIDEQNISVEANSIIIILFRDYLSTESQKEKLQKILIANEREKQKKLKEKYNSDNIFQNDGVKQKQEQVQENMQLIEVKEKSFFQKIIEKIKKFLGGYNG